MNRKRRNFDFACNNFEQRRAGKDTNAADSFYGFGLDTFFRLATDDDADAGSSHGAVSSFKRNGLMSEGVHLLMEEEDGLLRTKGNRHSKRRRMSLLNYSEGEDDEYAKSSSPPPHHTSMMNHSNITTNCNVNIKSFPLEILLQIASYLVPVPHSFSKPSSSSISSSSSSASDRSNTPHDLLHFAHASFPIWKELRGVRFMWLWEEVCLGSLGFLEGAATSGGGGDGDGGECVVEGELDMFSDGVVLEGKDGRDTEGWGQHKTNKQLGRFLAWKWICERAVLERIKRGLLGLGNNRKGQFNEVSDGNVDASYLDGTVHDNEGRLRRILVTQFGLKDSDLLETIDAAEGALLSTVEQNPTNEEDQVEAVLVWPPPSLWAAARAAEGAISTEAGNDDDDDFDTSFVLGGIPGVNVFIGNSATESTLALTGTSAPSDSFGNAVLSTSSTSAAPSSTQDNNQQYQLEPPASMWQETSDSGSHKINLPDRSKVDKALLSLIDWYRLAIMIAQRKCCDFCLSTGGPESFTRFLRKPTSLPSTLAIAENVESINKTSSTHPSVHGEQEGFEMKGKQHQTTGTVKVLRAKKRTDCPCCIFHPSEYLSPPCEGCDHIICRACVPPPCPTCSAELCRGCFQNPSVFIQENQSSEQGSVGVGGGGGSQRRFVGTGRGGEGGSGSGSVGGGLSLVCYSCRREACPGCGELDGDVFLCGECRDARRCGYDYSAWM
jgi:hypothetical protein